ncbi:uncharacterized protein LOC119829769 [Zerene cesonia]|uniref:uncharacterized protein LOC119829769 n=1 Tax=Zerene cesonia TaxID=33412 RepID=UPI0018E4E75A|nr:uncharacterized protein LOC119829769 [Zerene cesonia]
MGTKALILFVCWMVVDAQPVSSEKNVKNVGIIDNISAESVSRLYHNVPAGVYASATPYGAYSFNVPSFVAPKSASGKEESVIVPITNSYLKDSYGNRFVETPQALSYRSSIPQQFVQLQSLPAHLSQPLVSPSVQFKQSTPHFFSPGQYNVQSIQGGPSANIGRYTVQQPIGYSNVQSFAPNSAPYSQFQPQGAQQQSGNNRNVYAGALTADNNYKINTEPKFQRLQDVPHIAFFSNERPIANQQTAQSGQLQQLQQLPKQTTVTTVVNGKKIALNLVTKPPLPLLDLSLLEPLTFANPLVPQVQHFLPRINQATYHKLPNVNVVQNKNNQNEFIVQNTKTYSSDEKPKNDAPKNKQKKIIQKHQTDEEKETPANPTISVNGVPNESPEFSYEINSPNYKETYTEKKVSYNKETESEPKTYNYEMKTENKPVHYSYEKNSQKKPVHVSYEHTEEKTPVQYNYEEHSQKEPVHYNYVKTSKEPVSHVHYENKNQNPKHLVYTLKPEEQDHSDQEKRVQHHPRENSGESSDESYDENNQNEDNDSHERPKNHEHHVGHQVHVGSPKNTHHHPEHRQVQYYHTTNQQDPNLGQHHNTPQSFAQAHKDVPIQHEQQYFQPIVPEYEEDIRILPEHKPHEAIRVDPNQHIRVNNNSPPRPQNHPATYDYQESLYASAPIVKGKPKQDTRNNDDSSENAKEDNDEIIANMFKEQEKNEENFEKSYKDAAYGFAAYDAPRMDIEKEIYNPESYGAPRYYSDYNIAKNPFQQYESEGDEFPKFARLDYKDTRDKMQEDYYLDYAVSRPESLRDRFRSKEGYYKMFKKQKPDYIAHEDEDDNKENAKYTSRPQYEYNEPEQKQKQPYRKHKTNPVNHEYDYSSDHPRDASAHATRPHLRYKSKTQFVEPQFQYGFEPISLPQLLDSELAAMASNENPKSEKQGTRKKIYKENLFIKKTSTKGAKNSS